MSKRDWRTPILFALIALLSVGSIAWVSWHSGALEAEKRMSRQQDADLHIQYAEDRIDQTCTQTDRAPLLKCVHDEIKSAQDHGRAQNDLDAQMAMALWAKLMTISGIVGSVLAGGGLYLVWRTLETTGDAVEAANATNNIMRQEQRPWVTLERDLFCDFYDDGGGSRIRWNYNFANKGKSPAFDVRFELKVIRCDQFSHVPSLVRDFAERCIAKPKLFKTPLIFPGETTEFRKNGSFASFRHDEAEIPTGEIRLKILTCLTYSTSLSGERVGVEARIFGIETKDRFGPFSAKVLEHSYARYIQ